MKYGSRYNRKILKQIEVVADAIEQRSETFAAMDDEQLMGYTDVLRKRLADGETEIDILADAFAAVREAATRVLGMRHFHVQLMGGVALYMGKIAEMGTGEGKTLVCTLPVYLWALRGKGVHVVTVNEYLANRDSQWMGRIFRYLGLQVGVVLSGQSMAVKQAMYNCDITYGVGSEFGFDYLRDNMVKTLSGKVQRGLACALVDEVDSILIDEARTPLIISGAKNRSQEEEDELKMYAQCDAFVRTLQGSTRRQEESKLEQVSRRLGGAETQEDGDYEVDDKGRTVVLTNQGMEKALSYFGVEDLADVDGLHHILNQCLVAHFIKKRDVDYLVRTREGKDRNGRKYSIDEIVIIDEFTGRLMPGRRYGDGLHQAIEAKEGVTVRAESVTYATITYQNYFRLYDTLAGMTGTAKTEEEEFATIYGLSVVCIPPNKPLVRVDENDRVFVTHAGKIRAIVAEIQACYQRKQPVLVGTVSVEKSEELSRELKRVGVPHNVLNAKNHEKEAEIIAQAGKKGVVTIATNMAGRGTDILLGGNADYMARTKTNAMFYKGDYPPALMADAMGSGVCLSKNPEEIRKFNKVRTAYQGYLRTFRQETDAEKAEVVALGGLRVIGSERHESRRIDNQLRGRSGRQGDPGSSVFFLSFDDDLLRLWSQNMAGLLARMRFAEDVPVALKFVARRIEQAQARIEGSNFAGRKQLLEFDNVLSDQRAAVYADRDKILAGEDIHQDILQLFPKGVAGLLQDYFADENIEDNWDVQRLNYVLERYLVPRGSQLVTSAMAQSEDFEGLVALVTKTAIEAYEEKCNQYNSQCPAMVERNLIPPQWSFADVERFVMANVVDNKWIQHMQDMDALKEGVSLRSSRYEPVVAYSKEGYELFEAMVADIQKSVIKELMCYNATPTIEVRLRARRMGFAGNLVVDRKGQAVRAVTKVGVNDPCPCGSGKKYKNCCGRRH